MGTLLVYDLLCYPVGLPGLLLLNFFQATRPPHVLDFVLLLVELNEISISPLLQPPQVPVEGSIALWCLSYSPQFSLQTFCLIIQIFNEQDEEDWIQYPSLWFTTSHGPPTTFGDAADPFRTSKFSIQLTLLSFNICACWYSNKG